MTGLLRTITTVAWPHGGQRGSRANALAALAAISDPYPAPTNIRTASAASSTANSRRRVASD